MAIFPCPIPKMTHELSTAWEQPAHSEIKFTSDGYSVVTKEGLEQLKQYDTSLPSGVYAGKMWKRAEGNSMYLCWYQDSPDEPGKCDIKYRKIMLMQIFDLINPTGEGNV